MMRVLIIKMSSLGDIIHTLPALTDAKRIIPNISFDWVVEESFSEIPLWHAAVNNIIPIALRRFRKQGWHRVDSKEISQFFTRLRQEKYDLVLDAQGLLKSAALTFACRGKKRCGFSWKSARESLASLFYQTQAVVPWGQHAVHRTRSLFAQSLGYTLPTTIADYGIEASRLPDVLLAKPYYVFLHGTTWDTKHWPETYWIILAQK
jgi:heptosyltransferase-1